MAEFIGSSVASRRAQTHCKRGHPLFGYNLSINTQGYRGCRTCHRAHNAARARKDRAEGKTISGYRKTIINLVGAERLKTAFDAARETGQMAPVYVAIGNSAKWRAIKHFYPKIAKAMYKIIVDARLTIKRPSVIVPVSDDIFDMISAAVPRHLPPDLRDDAIQNMWVAVREGRVKRNEIAVRAREFVSAQFQTNHNAWGTRSLDAPIWIDSSATLLDRLSNEAGGGYWDINMMASTGRRK
jgi:hypothetical protein